MFKVNVVVGSGGIEPTALGASGQRPAGWQAAESRRTCGDDSRQFRAPFS